MSDIRLFQNVCTIKGAIIVTEYDRLIMRGSDFEIPVMASNPFRWWLINYSGKLGVNERWIAYSRSSPKGQLISAQVVGLAEGDQNNWIRGTVVFAADGLVAVRIHRNFCSMKRGDRPKGTTICFRSSECERVQSYLGGWLEASYRIEGSTLVLDEITRLERRPSKPHKTKPKKKPRPKLEKKTKRLPKPVRK